MQQIASGKERNYLFDNMKVLLTFFMVSAHYIRISGSFDVSSFGGFFYIIAFSFIMQGFLFVSGYFPRMWISAVWVLQRIFCCRTFC